MEISSSENNGIQIVRVSGRLDVSSAPQFIERCQGLAKLPTVLDMENLEYLSSAGLRALHISAKALPGLVVANFIPFCKEIYEISGFASIVPDYPTVEDAVASLS